MFRTARGGPLNDTGYGEVWQRARPLALTPAQPATPLARRPYDLRHAAVSLWLNSGVPATEVARRAGHGVAVLLRVYANCIDGQADPPTSASATRSTSPAATDLTPEAGVGFSCGAESVLRAGGGNPKGRAALAGP